MREEANQKKLKSQIYFHSYYQRSSLMLFTESHIHSLNQCLVTSNKYSVLQEMQACTKRYDFQDPENTGLKGR